MRVGLGQGMGCLSGRQNQNQNRKGPSIPMRVDLVHPVTEEASCLSGRHQVKNLLAIPLVALRSRVNQDLMRITISILIVYCAALMWWLAETRG